MPATCGGVTAWEWTRTLRPAPVRMPSASARVFPRTSGTSTSAGPVERISVTSLPLPTEVPATGSVLTTRPWAMVELEADRADGDTVNPACWSVDVAVTASRLVTSGTAT